MSDKKKYVQVGVGGRARFFYESIGSTYRETSELMAICDINKTRLEYVQNFLERQYCYPKVKLYGSEDFERMIKEQKPDCVIVTSIDRTHHKYIVKAMELGCDVISEKPMTIDENKCREIFDAIERTGKNLRVTFNYRYAPHSSKVRELIMEDRIGEVKAVHFDWFLNTSHGADYFRRWHRDKRNSGGLQVHKSTHHFDLVNFWLGSRPKTVFAMGDLMFYGRENAENRGETNFYYRAYGSANAKNDPFALQMKDNENLEDLYLNAEKDDGYIRDQSVFGDGISIEDTMGVMVRYENNAILTYSLTAYSPVEGFRAVITGTKGRIEVNVAERAYVNAGGEKENEGAIEEKSVIVHPMFKSPYQVDIEEKEGAHGGGDPVLLEDIFGTIVHDPLNRAASHIDGAASILIGIAANKSMAAGLPVNVKDIIDLPGW